MVWWRTKDGDEYLIEAYEQHYSCYHYKDGRKRTQCVGPGEVYAMRTWEADAFFVWRKFIDDCINVETGERQHGVNNAIFINKRKDKYLSSDLIRQADAVADVAWPNQRHYTYVDASKIRSTNAGFCYLKAGWRKCGKTKGGLIILEK